MSNEPLKKSSQSISQKESFCTKGKKIPNITVVFPAYNEEAYVGSVVLLTRLYANNAIVVDDGSLDRTREIAQKAGALVISHDANKGKNAALETGVKAAILGGADIIVTMNSNGQHDPEDIPKLTTPILEGKAEIVNGSRYLNELSKKGSIYRRVSKNLLDRFINTNSYSTITDPESSFRAFTASTKDVLCFNMQNTIGDIEILEKACKSGIRVKEMEIGVSNPFKDPLSNPFTYIFENLKTVANDIEANKPLYFYSVPGFALATCALYMGFRFLEGLFLGTDILQTWSAFLMIFLAVAGIYLTVRGIVIHSLVEATLQTEVSS